MVVNTNTTESISKVLSDTLIIGWLSILSYVVSFLYQSGYFLYFGIPNYLVEINFTQIFIALISVCIFLFVIFSIFNILSEFGFLDKSTAIKRTRNFSIVLFVVLIFESFLFYNIDKRIFWGCIVLAVLRIVIEFGIPLIAHKNKIIVEDKLTVQEKIEDEEKNLIKKLLIFLGRQIFNCLIISVLVLLFSYQIGYLTAANQHKFLTIDNADTKSIIIQPYKDLFIVLDIKDKKNLSGKINLINLKDFNSEISVQKFEKIIPPEIKCGIDQKSIFFGNC